MGFQFQKPFDMPSARRRSASETNIIINFELKSINVIDFRENPCQSIAYYYTKTYVDIVDSDDDDGDESSSYWSLRFSTWLMHKKIKALYKKKTKKRENQQSSSINKFIQQIMVSVWFVSCKKGKKTPGKMKAKKRKASDVCGAKFS